MPRAPLPVRTLSRRLLVTALAFATVHAPVRPPLPCEAGDARLDELVNRYKATLGRHDDVAYASERDALDAIADLDTPDGRRTLRGLAVAERDLEASCDGRRMALLLGALVRRGGAAEFDFAIRTVEAARCRGLEAALPRVLGAAVASTARAHLREVVLVKGTAAVRAAAARALGAVGDREAVLPLLGVLREDDLVVRAEALFALGELHDEGAVPAMTIFLAGDDPRLREVAARALGVLGSERALPGLVRALDDPVPRVVESAASALALLAPKGVAISVPALLARWEKSRGRDDRLDDGFERALTRVTGAEVGSDPDLWKSWWAANKDRPPAEVARRDAPTTIAGARYYGFSVRSSHAVFVHSIYFLSDGHPSVGSIVDPDTILAQVREMNRWRRVRIHTIALLKGEPPAGYVDLEDPQAAERFMRRLAEENDGRFVEVR